MTTSQRTGVPVLGMAVTAIFGRTIEEFQNILDQSANGIPTLKLIMETFTGVVMSPPAEAARG